MYSSKLLSCGIMMYDDDDDDDDDDDVYHSIVITCDASVQL